MSTGGKGWPKVILRRDSRGAADAIRSYSVLPAGHDKPSDPGSTESEVFVPISSVAERLTSNDTVAALAIVWEEHAGGRAPGPFTRRRILESLVAAAFTEEG